MTPSPAERLRALALVTAAHAMLIAWLVSLAPAATAPPAAATLIVESVPAAEPPTPDAYPPPHFPEPLAFAEPTPPELPAEPADTGLVDTESACAPQEAVAAALADDSDARAAAARTPAELRSITGAVILWNTGWSEAAAGADAPLARVRLVVEAALSRLPEPCLAMPVAGPRLLPIPGERETMFLVFGSGEWRWADLVSRPA
jgi:hypothetical protein